MRTIKLTTGAEVPLDGDLMTVIESLYLEITAKRELERTFEDTVKEIQEIIDQMTDDERRHLPRACSSISSPSRTEARRADEEAPEGRLTLNSVSLNYLATRFTCSWPWSTMVLLCDGRLACGCADPYGRRVLGDASGHGDGGSTGATAANLRRDLNAGGSKFCGDCPPSCRSRRTRHRRSGI